MLQLFTLYTKVISHAVFDVKGQVSHRGIDCVMEHESDSRIDLKLGLMDNLYNGRWVDNALLMMKGAEGVVKDVVVTVSD